jgi:hypothetical protein
MTTLDEVAGRAALEGPYFLKLDVQGYELEVLRGGTKLLRECGAILMEVALLEYNESAPLVSEVVAFMKERGFVLYDICGQSRREVDGALFQADLIFVPIESPLRAPKPFWLAEPGAKATLP